VGERWKWKRGMRPERGRVVRGREKGEGWGERVWGDVESRGGVGGGEVERKEERGPEGRGVGGMGERGYGRMRGRECRGGEGCLM
jgi:hypothetical protein